MQGIAHNMFQNNISSLYCSVIHNPSPLAPQPLLTNILWLTSSCAQSLQLYPALCYPVGCSQPGSSLHGIIQARILEWVAISSSRGSFQSKDQTQIS